ncbi:hypothetical protein LLEC1_03592 [Akanthomyces lecanii]|uniref:Uncharacterized protein n=1 Tax=Cordyceps confragosa TaxID=2714763 RepID=A0A179I7P7_CORDF|nr:hypothetical protein LLEC1_03592 [Akanthomyces lecanii]
MKRPSVSSRGSSSSDASNDAASMRLTALRGQEPSDAAALLQSEPGPPSRHPRASVTTSSFAQLPAVLALCQQPRAHSHGARARLIMSSIVPDMGDDGAVLPHCTWHPETADGGNVPQGGRWDARSSGTAWRGWLSPRRRRHRSEGGEIFKLIIAQPVRFAFMSDYENKLCERPRQGASLNGDAAVVCVLRLRSENPTNVPDAWPSHWDIDEDGYIGDEDVGHMGEGHSGTITALEIELLGKSLRADLPTVNKDVLILMAAYEGNMDRYARLARPDLIRGEEACIVRDIYHSTCFVKWWRTRNSLAAAVNARRRMVNDLSHLTPEIADEDLPDLTWYPWRLEVNTLFEVVRREPKMWPTPGHLKDISA